MLKCTEAEEQLQWTYAYSFPPRLQSGIVLKQDNRTIIAQDKLCPVD